MLKPDAYLVRPGPVYPGMWAWNLSNCHEYRESIFLKTMSYSHQITCCLCRSQDSVDLFFRALSTPQLFCSPWRGKFKSVVHFTCVT